MTPGAIVLNGAETGLHAARALARRGIPTALAVTDARQPGAFTRACPVHTVPDARTLPEARTNALNALALRFDRPTVVLPTNDDDVAHLAHWRSCLSEPLVPALARPAALDALLDKGRAEDLARQVGVSAPRTRRVREPGDLAVPGDFPFPAVLKPLYARDWRAAPVRQRLGPAKGVRVDDIAGARRAYAKVADLAPEALLQEWIPGGDDAHLVCGTLMRPDGTLAAWATFRKLLQYPPGLGLGCAARLEIDPDVAAAAEAVLAAAGFDGVAEVEFKRDPRDGRLRLIEVNPRLWDQHGLARQAGVDLAWLQVRQLSGEQPARREPAVAGARWLRGAGLIGAATDAARQGRIAGCLRIAAMVRQPVVWAYWDARDPRPGLADLWARMAEIARRAAARLPGRATASQRPRQS
jgi:predicted ATP-grasp superfamily ATP-dependent carboligase